MKPIFFSILFVMVSVCCFAQGRSQMSAMTEDSLKTTVFKDTTLRMYINPVTGSRHFIFPSNGKKAFYKSWVPKPTKRKED